MAQDKGLQKLKDNPKGVRFTELENAVLRAGFRLENAKGSHRLYKRGKRILTIVKPHGKHKHCHWLDVRDAIRTIEEGGE